MIPQFRWGVAKGAIVIMTTSGDDIDFAANVIFMDTFVEIFYGRVFFIATKNLPGFLLPAGNQMSNIRRMTHQLTCLVCKYHEW